jgi:hypothetical protein
MDRRTTSTLTIEVPEMEVEIVGFAVSAMHATIATIVAVVVVVMTMMDRVD